MVNYKICTPHFVTFQHSLMQLKCTWSSISLKLGCCWWRSVGLAVSASHFPCKQLFPIKIAPSHVVIWIAHVTHGSLPLPRTRVHIPNSISISSAVFAGFITVTDRPTDTPHYSVCNNMPHLHSTEMQPNNELCNTVVKDGTNQWHNINEIYNVRLYQATDFLNSPSTLL